MMPLADIDHLQQEKQVLCGTHIDMSYMLELDRPV